MAANRQFDIALGILQELRAAGYEAYLAGGCVRDLLLGREPIDYDVATSATPDVVLNMFPRTFGVGAHFGVVLVATDVNGGDPAEKKEFVLTEVATFRSDGAYSDGRHPDAVKYTESAEEDVRRRDFTINGLLLDPEKLFPQGLKPALLSEDNVRAEARTLQIAGAGALAYQPVRVLRSAVIDYVGGLADLDAGVIRAIGRPELRFEEDRLRMLRAVRFAARFGFEIEDGTRAAIRALAPRIHAVSRERVRDELTKMLTEGHARRAFELLDETGLLAQLLPEVAKMKGVEQPPQFHPEGDVWTHTLLLLDQLEAGSAATLAWGALLHDVGKPPTFRSAPDRIRFDGHVEVGAAMGAEICRRFRFSNEEMRQILALIENHMRFADAPRMKASTLKRFFRLEDFDQHLELHKMDCLAAHRNLEIYEFVRERFEAMPEETVRPRPLLTGRELIAAGYAPGPGFKEMLSTVEDAQLEGTIATEEEAMALVREKFPFERQI
ncbi:MAG: CCA tRNA nucleotidyltransferase [Terracidiphilus sp.]